MVHLDVTKALWWTLHGNDRCSSLFHVKLSGDVNEVHLKKELDCFYTTKIVRSWFPAFSWPCLADDIIRVFLQWIQSNFNATRWSLSVNDPSRRSGFHLRSAVKLREKWFTSNIILPHGWLGLWRSCRCRWPSVGHQTNDLQWFRSGFSTLCLEGGLAEHFRPLLFAVTPAEQAGCFSS